MDKCGVCGQNLNGKGTKAAKYCSGACRQKAYRQRQRATRLQIPGVLKNLRRWVRWRRVSRNGRTTKMPITTVGRPASSTDPKTWTDFPTVSHSPLGDGYGFVLGGGIGCIDLDDCVNNAGSLSHVAERILALVGPTFVEKSPSGRGLQVWIQASESPGRVLEFEGQSVEVYTVGRYMTVTGDYWPGSVNSLAVFDAPASRLVEEFITR